VVDSGVSVSGEGQGVMSQPRWIPHGPEGAPLVFVIDDDPELVRCFRLFLQRGGFRTASSDTADDGLEGIRRFRPALVIVDLWLRVPDGGSLHRTWSAADPIHLTTLSFRRMVGAGKRQ